MTARAPLPKAVVPCEERRSLAWECAFTDCCKLRLYEGGRPELFRHHETCAVCGSRVATALADRAAVLAVIDQYLL